MEVVFISIGRRETNGWPGLSARPMFTSVAEFLAWVDNHFKDNEKNYFFKEKLDHLIENGFLYFVVGRLNKEIDLFSLIDSNCNDDPNCKGYFYEEFYELLQKREKEEADLRESFKKEGHDESFIIRFIREHRDMESLLAAAAEMPPHILEKTAHHGEYHTSLETGIAMLKIEEVEKTEEEGNMEHYEDVD